MNLNDFREGLTLSSADVEIVEVKELFDSTILTIENLTSFYQYEKEDTLVIYLGGYHNTIRREFLKRIHQGYPEKRYFHFGDIDAGGFQILNHLRSMTGIPFEPYLMDKETLEQYEHLCRPLTENDRKRLIVPREQPEFHEVIDYMLEHNIKLEQEQIDVS